MKEGVLTSVLAANARAAPPEPWMFIASPFGIAAGSSTVHLRLSPTTTKPFAAFLPRTG